MATQQSVPPTSRIETEKARLQRQGNQVISRLTPLKIYLTTYNALSSLLWAHLLLLTILSTLSPSPSLSPSSNILTRLLSSPGPRGAYEYHHLGWWVKVTQSLAVLEVLHAGLGWVRSPVGTTAAQVASRLWTVWGVVEACPKTHDSVLFTTMLFAWSATEVVRYPFYAASVLGIELEWLNYLRYTTFLPLYPLGASSEAFLAFSTLPPLSTLPHIPSFSPGMSILKHLPTSVGKAALRSKMGRNLLWRIARASAARQVSARVGVRAWGWLEILRLVLFLVWWPSLVVLYSHMLRQRRRVLGKGRAGGVKMKMR